jgi:hypothetical protein
VEDGPKGHHEEGRAALSAARESCQRQVAGVPADVQSQLRELNLRLREIADVPDDSQQDQQPCDQTDNDTEGKSCNHRTSPKS